MKKIFFLLSIVIFICSSEKSFAQNKWAGAISMTRAEIISKFGTEYETAESKEGVMYIYYTAYLNSDASGDYESTWAFYFEKDIKNVERCFKWIIIEPIAESNKNVNYFNKTYVKVGDLIWKDFPYKTIITISFDDFFCVIGAVGEN